MIQGAGRTSVLAAAGPGDPERAALDEQSRALGFFQGCVWSAFAVGPPIGGLVLGRWGWPAVWSYRVIVGLALVAVVGAVGLLGPAAGSPAEDRAPAPPFPSTWLGDGMACPVLLVSRAWRAGRPSCCSVVAPVACWPALPSWPWSGGVAVFVVDLRSSASPASPWPPSSIWPPTPAAS